jgi:hypothetical protein
MVRTAPYWARGPISRDRVTGANVAVAVCGDQELSDADVNPHIEQPLASELNLDTDAITGFGINGIDPAAVPGGPVWLAGYAAFEVEKQSETFARMV